MNMRTQFTETVTDVLAKDETVVLLLGDIGVYGFRDAFRDFPKRVYNVGILEQATVSMASGMAMAGLRPIVHTIAPFIVERSAEQLKIDFCYQNLGGNFVSVGASYDYAALGCTHHCPGDVGLLANIPGIEIVVPGTSQEFDSLFRKTYANGNPTYYRLSERENTTSQLVEFGKATVVRKGSLATIVVVGPVLSPVLEGLSDLDVTVLYYTTVYPFDGETLRENAGSGKVLIVEPFYRGTLASHVWDSVKPRAIALDCVGVPRAFLRNYGKADDHDRVVGLTAVQIRTKLEELVRG